MKEAINKVDTNSVNGASLKKQRGISLGRMSHVGEFQVASDRHQATSLRNKSNMMIATWNVRTMHQDGKHENVQQEMKKYKMDILGIAEARWKGVGKTESEGYTTIYSGGERHERGVAMIMNVKLQNP